MFAPDNPDVNDMVEKTLARLKTACYGSHQDIKSHMVMQLPKKQKLILFDVFCL